MSRADQPFWRRKRLEEMTAREWESLCDGCGQCCLLKLEDADTGELFHTKLSCRLLDIGACRCGDYENRHERVADCARMTPESVPRQEWLPATCAYRLVAEGRDLYWWHPLVSGDPETVHRAGVSVRGWAQSETGVPESHLDRFVVPDPSRGPGRGQGSRSRG